MASRITSNKIRIETSQLVLKLIFQYNFQNNIQQNKDWNLIPEHHHCSKVTFQNNIQQNKDWNLI